MDCIAYFFTRNKTHLDLNTMLVKKYKIGAMPSFCRMFVNTVKRSTRPKTSEMFYTANLFLPFALRAEITFLPFFVFIRVRKPWVLFLGVLCGWNVLFITVFPYLV